MAQPLLIPYPENATIQELKQVSRISSSETATRCTAIQMLLAGAGRQLVCDTLLVTNRILRKWINRFISKNDQYLDYGQCLMASKNIDQMAWMATKIFATIFARFKSYRKNLAYNESTLVQ